MNSREWTPDIDNLNRCQRELERAMRGESYPGRNFPYRLRIPPTAVSMGLPRLTPEIEPDPFHNELERVVGQAPRGTVIDIGHNWHAMFDCTGHMMWSPTPGVWKCHADSGEEANHLWEIKNEVESGHTRLSMGSKCLYRVSDARREAILCLQAISPLDSWTIRKIVEMV